jgi:DNA-binding MarR family transcriptional regulator
MDESTDRIEQQLTILLRRVQSIHVSTSSGDVDLDRSGYGILGRLADEGPQRIGLLAAAFGLDPSTITRQVQALEKVALVHRQPDPVDRRAAILDLTSEGREVLARTRAYRRKRLEDLLADWPDADRSDLARLLTKVNTSITDLVEHGRASRDGA